MIYGVSFSEDLALSLAQDLLTRFKSNPFELATQHLILPTKRACLAVKNAFLKCGTENGLLLPKMSALYELDVLNADIPPALSSLERTLLLAKLAQAKPNILTYDQALKMAISLGELLNLAYQFDLDLSHLDELVEIERFSEHWQETVQFLDILHTHWPHILAEKGVIDPMDRTVRLIRAFTKELSEHPENSYILAGLTDRFPAARELMQTAIQNKNILILKENYVKSEKDRIPYFTDLHHPQEQWAIEALTKDSWAPNTISQEALKNVRVINAATSAEEALTVALLLREVLETPNQTGALVTTDRTLARQVINQMSRWGIQLDDSAGTPLNHTPIGLFMQLLCEVGLNPCGANYLALLKHPLSADGKMPGDLRLQVQTAEKTLREENAKWDFPLATNFDKWISLFQINRLVPFETLLSEHILLAEQLAKSADKTATERLWSSDTGKQMFQLLCDLQASAQMIGEVESQSYPEILKLFMQQISSRPKYGMHPRLDVLGPIEARFHHPDVCVIAGLNESVFPSLPETGPWLNRPMRQKLGVPTPEEKIAELAFDFAHCFCSKKVYLTRALKVDGAQAVPSRFLARLNAVAQINGLQMPEYQANLATLLDKPEKMDAAIRPAPCPPVKDRPKRLPVTKIEDWRKNPYGIYARYILKLFPLKDLENPSKEAEYGTLVHKIIELFLTEAPQENTRQRLGEIAEEVFRQSTAQEVDKTLFQIKFSAVADFVNAQYLLENERVKSSLYEEKIAHTFQVDGAPFELYGVADRVDTLSDGSARIIDYKTYQPPSKKMVKDCFAPQLPLEALLLSEAKQQQISSLAYWWLNNKKEGSCALEVINNKEEVSKLIDTCKEGLFKMVRAFQNENMPYEVYPIASQAPRYDDYKHLARVQEWGNNEEDE